MAIGDLNTILEQYFTSHHCDILESNGARLSVQLTENMDKAIMNRPFYWHYIKKIGREGEPAVLTFNTDITQHLADDEERIHYGSPRLQQILDDLTSNNRFTKLFQSYHAHNRTPLYPWLVINLKINYTGKQHKAEMMSIGLNLISGMMQSGMMEALYHKDLQTSIPDYCYTISPMIKIKSGYRRIEQVILDYINRQEHEWARETLKARENELELLDHFYAEGSNDTEHLEYMKNERSQINRRLSPAITMNVANGGLFYLVEHPFES